MLFVCGERCVVLVYGHKYEGTSIIVSILGLSVATYALSSPIDFGIWAMGRPDANFWISLGVLGISATLGFWLVNSLGSMGAACGLLVCNLSILIVRYTVFSRLIRSVI